MHNLQKMPGGLPELWSWKKDMQFVFTSINKEFARLLGFQSPEEALGKSDFEIPCAYSEYADIFRANDKQVIAGNATVKFIEIQQMANLDWKILFVVKSPSLEENKIVGTEGYCIDITEIFSQFSLINEITGSNHLTPKTVLLDSKIEDISLTPRQSECLFFLLRGKTAKEIGKIINLSYKTIEYHIDLLKDKFQCQNKKTLIEKAIAQGFLNTLPTCLYTRQLSLIIN